MRAVLCALVVLGAAAVPAVYAKTSLRSSSAWDLAKSPNVNPLFESWDGAVGEDPLAQVSDFLDAQEANPEAFSLMQLESGLGAQKVHGFCEICILIMQMKQRGQPHMCAGLNPDYYVTVRPLGPAIRRSAASATPRAPPRPHSPESRLPAHAAPP